MSVDRERQESDRLESILLSWITAASVFFLAGITLSSKENIRNVISICMFGVTIYMFSVALLSYYNERISLLNQGIVVDQRVDLLSLSIVLAIPILIWFTYEEAMGNV